MDGERQLPHDQPPKHKLGSHSQGMKPLENDRQGEAEHYYYNTEDTAGAGRPSDRDSPSKDDKLPPQPNEGDKNHKVTKLPQMVDKPSPKEGEGEGDPESKESNRGSP